MTDPYLAEDVACPTCGAQSGYSCVRASGELRQPHDNRRIAYQRGIPQDGLLTTVAHSETMTVEVPVDVLRAARKALEVSMQVVTDPGRQALLDLLAALPEPPKPKTLRGRIYDALAEHWDDTDMAGMVDAILDEITADVAALEGGSCAGTTVTADGCFVHDYRKALLDHLATERMR